MKRSLFKSLLLAAIFSLVFFYLQYPQRLIGLGHYDEGIMVFAAEELMRGKIPYKDFYFLYPPGFHYALGLVFKLFGTTLVTERIFMLVLHTVAVFLAVFYSVFTGTLLFGIVTGFMLLNFTTDTDLGVVIFILLAYLLFDAFLKKGKAKYLFFAGILLGLSCFFRLDFGVYSTIAVSITLAIYSLTRTRTEQRKLAIKHTLVNYWNYYKSILIGLGIGSIPLMYISLVAGIVQTFKHLIVYTKNASIYRDLPFPLLFPDFFLYLQHASEVTFQKYFTLTISAWPFYFPLIVAGIILYTVYTYRKAIRSNSPYLLSQLLIGISILCYSPYMLVRSDVGHTYVINFFAFIALPFTLSALKDFLRHDNVVLLCIFAIILTIFGLWDIHNIDVLISFIPSFLLSGIFLYFMTDKLFIIKNYKTGIVFMMFMINLLLLGKLKIMPNKERLMKVDLPKSQSIYVPYNEQPYIELIKFLQENIRAKEPILSASLVHDKIMVNDTLLYFLSDGSSVTRYWQYDPGIQSSKEVQEYMVSELSSNKPRFIVVWLRGSNSNEPNLSSQSSGVTLLDEYIKSNYMQTKQFGDYVILEKIEKKS